MMRVRSETELTTTPAAWLGRVPKTWRHKRLKYAVTLQDRRIDGTDAEQPYVGLEHIESWSGRLSVPPNSSSTGIVNVYKPGDVLVGKLRPYLAKIHLAELEGVCTTEAFVLRCLPDILPGFLFYSLANAPAIENINSSTYGAKMPRANWEFVGEQIQLIPPCDEQSNIIDFLDRATARIDALISKKRRLLELLEEKRLAVITHGVTKGLNPNVPMKNSGIEWFGQIPAHWEILPLTRVVRQFVDYRGSTPTKLEDGVPLITATQIKNGRIEHSLDPVFISEEEYESRMTRGFPEKGDVLVTTEAPLGETAQIEDERVAPGQRIILMKPDLRKITKDYLFAHFRSDVGRTELLSRPSGSTASGIRADRLRASKVFVPPLQEQKAITAHIAKATSYLSPVGAVIAMQIARLREYRSALITDAVTGKIDVRGLADKEAAA
jgi:type I restriction enzyme S subunit